MKQLITLLFVCISIVVVAQAPPQIKYQGVARDAAGSPITNGTITVQFDIHDVTPAGIIIYTETHSSVTTNQFGLFSINIGSITPLPGGTFGTGDEFLEVSVDFGSGLTSMGTSQLLSVPYALYADTSGSSTPGPSGPTGANGLNGATGPTGATGNNGVAGSTGAAGATGPAGTNGATGLTGAIGAVGPTGPSGANGINGTNGATGAVGAQGPTGLTGATGPAGSSFAIGFKALVGPYSTQNVDIPFSSEIFDDGSNFSGTSFLCPSSGVYQFSGSRTATGTGQVNLFVNGALREVLTNNNSAGVNVESFATLLSLSAGDAITLRIPVGGGSITQLIFSGHRVY